MLSGDDAIRSPARSHSRKTEVKIAEKIVMIFIKYHDLHCHPNQGV